jgi:hypothetical protein
VSEQPSRVRASDAERERVAEVLRHAMSEGRLTLTEGEERLAAAYATTYRDELPPITADLPPAEPAPDRGKPGRGRADRRPFGMRRRRPAISLLALAALALGIWAVTADGPVWPVILLGVLAIMLTKRSRYGHHGCRDHGRDHDRDRRDHGRDHGRDHDH